MQERTYWEVEVGWREGLSDPRGKDVKAQVRAVLEAAGCRTTVDRVGVSDVYLFLGDSLDATSMDLVSRRLLADPAAQVWRIRGPGEAGPASRSARRGVEVAAAQTATVQKRPGVMDPIEGSLLEGLADLGIEGVRVRTATRY